jgi:hypothetical protein
LIDVKLEKLDIYTMEAVKKARGFRISENGETPTGFEETLSAEKERKKSEFERRIFERPAPLESEIAPPKSVSATGPGPPHLTLGTCSNGKLKSGYFRY